MSSSDVRQELIDALRLDLVGPGERIGPDGATLGDPAETLSQRPSAWYLTGFLVPTEATPEQRTDEQANDELESAAGESGLDDDVLPEPAAARIRYLPSSIGLSLLVPPGMDTVAVGVHWGDYRVRKTDEDGKFVWDRIPRREALDILLPTSSGQPMEVDVPKSEGLRVSVLARDVAVMHAEEGLPDGTRSVSVFLVNRRVPQPDEVRDQAFAFQAQIEVHGASSFVPRPNLRGLESYDWDDRVADVQYRDAFEFGVGHNVAVDAVENTPGDCHEIRTCWTPQADVEKVAPASMDVERSMSVLSEIEDGGAARALLGPLVLEYREWIEQQRAGLPSSPASRVETCEELLNRAGVAANRIDEGIGLLAEPDVLEAFRIMNRAMLAAARQRLKIDEPSWRPFQLAFVLMNLAGIVNPQHDDRETVDLLFFPTGGGKTEAYLGLAAFVLVLRRLRNPGVASAGLTVLMRYTLRLLTLDQLGRAAGLICALELERQKDVEKLGAWPFEIGLWVGQAATPNRMGTKQDRNGRTAREKTIAFQRDQNKPSPIPLEECPWCGTRFKASSFRLLPHPDEPTDLRITCANRRCPFTRDNPLPILAVDEPIYRRLPCFLIATVDKFAAMPWTGEVGQFFGRVDRFDEGGFYGPCHPQQGRPLPVDRLPPPELIVQDELHLISGPLGTIAGLYETALDSLCSTTAEDGSPTRPKVVASTATVRRADDQVKRLFARGTVDIFPPPGPDRRDSFFAITEPASRTPARRYLGVAAQGRSPKVVMLRVYLALLGAAQRAWLEAGGAKNEANPADPYMTLLGYFNSLRELGGARRVVEDEVGNRVHGYGSRRRVDEQTGLFTDRRIAYEVVELTSRVSTDKVADAKRRLERTFHEDDHVDVAIATNMISVGLDITRLGLMVAFGQPKTSSEYIQATSRVGRDQNRPGLVVTILNAHKPRDRSHYERFCAYHESFYRSVEATSVTPFSPRALDRALAAVLVALARQGHVPMVPPFGAGEIVSERPRLGWTVTSLRERALECGSEPQKDAERIHGRADDLLDDWSRIAEETHEVGGHLQYQRERPGAERLLHEMLDPELKTKPKAFAKFRANRSMRDVEPTVNLWLGRIDGSEVEEDDR